MTSLSDYAQIIGLLAPSLATAAAVTIAGGAAGVFVALRREALLALAVPQAAAVGVALALRYHWPTLPPALAVVAMGVLVLTRARARGAATALLPALYVAGLCLSFLVIANSGQHVEAMQNLMTGMDVAVTPTAAALAVPALLVIATFTALLWRRWLLIAQVPAAAQLAGLRPARWNACFLALLVSLVLIGTATLGTVLVLVMLFLPAATVLPWGQRIVRSMALAVIVGIAALVAGLVLSVEMRWPMSQSIGGAAAALLILSNTAAALLILRRSSTMPQREKSGSAAG